MVRVYCDRCGGECVNFHVILSVNSISTTSQGEMVDAMYDGKTKHLCQHCKDSLEQWYGKSLGLLNEEEMAQLKRQRMAEDMEYVAPVAAPPVGDPAERAHP